MYSDAELDGESENAIKCVQTPNNERDIVD